MKIATQQSRLARSGQSGMTIFEVLIALAILSIGLVGMAAMHLVTLQNVHSAYNRSVASTIALDLEERLWLALASDGLTGCPDVTATEGAAAHALAAHWQRYTAGGEADGDWNWSSSKLVQLPGLTITPGTAVTGTNVTEIPVTLSWNENRFTDVETLETAGKETFVYNVRILCREAVGGAT